MTAPLVYVVDASVAAQVVSPEPLTAQATALFALLNGNRATFHVPELFYVECANIFWKKKQRGVCSESQAVQALADLLALPLISAANSLLAVEALKLAVALDITAYDACYLALAERLGVPFITADQKLERKLAGSGRAVLWLAPGRLETRERGLKVDEFGFNVSEDRVRIHDLHATLLHLLGFDHTKLTYRFQGRDFRLTDVHGQLVRKLLA